MRNDPICVNPPAIVRATEEWSINEVKDEIVDDHGHQQRHASHAIEYGRRVGEKLLRIKGRLAHGQFQGWIEKNMPFNYRQAARYMRIAREWGKIVKSDNVSLLNVDESLKLLTEDPPAEQHAKSGEVPFAPAGEPEREPGDMTPAELEQDKLDTELKAAIQAVLCKDCKRKGVSCDKCRAAIYKLQNPSDEAPAPPKKPTGPKKPPSTNGQPVFLWPDYQKSYGETVRAVDKICNGYGVPVVAPEAEALRHRLDDWNKDFKAWAAKVSKQKVPE
jgi:hypothetical protein